MVKALFTSAVGPWFKTRNGKLALLRAEEDGGGKEEWHSVAGASWLSNHYPTQPPAMENNHYFLHLNTEHLTGVLFLNIAVFQGSSTGFSRAV